MSLLANSGSDAQVACRGLRKGWVQPRHRLRPAPAAVAAVRSSGAIMRIGVIGTGRQAKRYLDPRNGLGVCKRFRASVGYEGIVVATHPTDHSVSALAAIGSRLPSLIEKPLVISAQELSEIEPALLGAVAPPMVAHTLLFSRRFAEIQELAKSAKHIAVDIGGPRPAGHDYSALLDWGPHAYSVGVALKAQSISFGDYPERRCSVTLDGVEHSLDTRGEENPTPMATQMQVFLDLIGGKPDWRAQPEFTLAVYERLFASQS